jgi:hypothetical protein
MLRRTLVFLLLALPCAGLAHETTFRPFVSGSYAALLAARPGQPFILFLWSTTCEPCREQFALLRELGRQSPRVPLVLVATDDIANAKAAGDILARHGLEHEDVWMFSGADTARLRREIDPRWDGKLPRTYLLDSAHQRQTIAGSLDRDRVLGWTWQATAMH